MGRCQVIPKLPGRGRHAGVIRQWVDSEGALERRHTDGAAGPRVTMSRGPRAVQCPQDVRDSHRGLWGWGRKDLFL